MPRLAAALFNRLSQAGIVAKVGSCAKTGCDMPQSANVYTLVKTAKANGLLWLEKKPSQESLDPFLQWNVAIQNVCVPPKSKHSGSR